MAIAAPDGHTRRRTALAFTLFGLVSAELVLAVVAAVAAGWTVADLVDAFVLTNMTIGLSCGVAGVLIAWQRPRNPLGWLLLAAGLCQSLSAAAAPLTVVGAEQGWPVPVLRTLATLIAYAWPWSIAVFLPLAVMVFPDGLLPGRRWRAAAWLAVVNGPLFTIESGADPSGALPALGPVEPWLVIPGYADLNTLWTVEEIVNLAVFAMAAAALVVRYRRGDEQRRRQLLWLVLALVGVVVVVAVWGVLRTGPILLLLAIALVPAAMTIAVLRHRLLDIRLVLSRTVLYSLLTAGVVAAYLGLVTVVDTVLRPVIDAGSPVLATLVIAVGFNPVRVRLQRLVDRGLYGDRSDPVRALARMGERLRDESGDIGDILTAVCEALRLPFAAVSLDGHEQARYGTPPERLERVQLVYQGEPVGDLVVGARSGQPVLDRTDRAALEALAAPLALAVHATGLTAAVQRSREAIVTAREEERRRLRRDLHDGLGPALTGISFQADAAGNLLDTDPAAAGDLLRSLRAAATEAIGDVRRLVYALRPPALDELGLVEALRRYADQLGSGAPQVSVQVADTLPALPAAVEVAAYRIAVEAITNAVRHSGGRRIDLHIGVGADEALEVAVHDDGPGTGGAGWTPGVGLSSMRERAAELGGTVSAAPCPDGGHVSARFPR